MDLDGLSGDLLSKLNEMDFDRNVLKNHLFQQPLPPLRFKKLIKQMTRASRNQNCLYNAVAVELTTDPSGTTVNQLIVKKRNGQSITVTAKTFIIATGALQAPRLLLNSNRVQKNGLGNDKNLVGKFLLDHPMGNLIQLQFLHPHKAHIYSDMKYAPDNKIKTGLVFTDGVQEANSLPNHCFYIRPSFVRGIDNTSEKIKLSLLTFLDRDKKVTARNAYDVVTHFNVVLQILAYKFSLNFTYRYADLFFVTEQIPNENSQVTLSDKRDAFGYPIAKVNWQLTEADFQSMEKAYNLLRSKAFSEEHYSFVHKFEDLNWKENFTSGAHHVGTARMGTSPDHAVVDQNLKVFGCSNLYISDGSVFPTAGNVNSGFTIAAFSARLADHLVTIQK